MSRIFRPAFGVLTGVLSFVYLIFVLNPVQMASVLLLPFSKSAFRRVNRWCARSIWGLWVIMAEKQQGIAVRITGDRPRPGTPALILPNHQTMADVLALMSLAWRCRQVGDLKWFVKDVVKWFPGFGWGMKFLDCIFVKRSWARDREGVERRFEKFRKLSIPLFLVSFLEGTRRTPAKQAKAAAFAAERGLEVPRHVLVPRTKGFVATVQGLEGHLETVYDVTIGYPDGVPSLIGCFAGRVGRIEVHLRVFDAESLPREAEDLEAWARNRFREKDRLLEELDSSGRFPGQEVGDPIRVFDWFRPERGQPSTASAATHADPQVDPDATSSALRSAGE